MTLERGREWAKLMVYPFLLDGWASLMGLIINSLELLCCLYQSECFNSLIS